MPVWLKRQSENTSRGKGGRLRTVDLLIEVAYFVKKVNDIFNIKRSRFGLVTKDVKLSRRIDEFQLVSWLLLPGKKQNRYF
jgi:hypothetical protein